MSRLMADSQAVDSSPYRCCLGCSVAATVVVVMRCFPAVVAAVLRWASESFLSVFLRANSPPSPQEKAVQKEEDSVL